MDELFEALSRCNHCAARFAATASAHEPRPVFRGTAKAKICIAGQAPGIRVHESGVPFNDPSGERLRGWLDTPPEIFYDENRIAILPMAFCFPGHDARRGDLPPPPDCAKLWRERLFAELPQIELILLIGKAAQDWHLGDKAPMTQRVRDWTAHGSHGKRVQIPLPHPSWRNNSWLKQNPWFETETLPKMREALHALL